MKRCNEVCTMFFQGAVARIPHTLGALLNQRQKNYIVFPPPFDSVFICQSTAGTPLEFATTER